MYATVCATHPRVHHLGLFDKSDLVRTKDTFKDDFTGAVEIQSRGK